MGMHQDVDDGSSKFMFDVAAFENTRKPKYRFKVIDMAIHWSVGPYDKPIIMQCEYSTARDIVTLERVWLSNVDVSGYISEAQWIELQRQITNAINKDRP